MGRPRKLPIQGEHYGRLVVIEVGKSTALCVCSCGEKVRYLLDDVRRFGGCRQCRKLSKARDSRKPEDMDKVTVSLSLPVQYVARLETLGLRTGKRVKDCIAWAIERLLHHAGV